jgi:homoserine kinase type II
MKIDAELHFQPTHKNISDILKNYSLSLIAYEPAQTGIENCTIFVDTNHGAYVLRIYRQQKKTDKEILQEIRFIDYLHAKGIPVAPMIPNNNKEGFTTYGPWQVVLMPKIPGTHANRYNQIIVDNLADVQAKMHKLALAYQQTSLHEPLTILQDDIFLPKLNQVELNDEAGQIIQRAKGYSVTLPKNLPSGLCHLDYDIDNILLDRDGDITAVLDFDDLRFAPFVVCLGYTLWHIMHQEDKSLVDRYLATYSEARKVTEAELALLPKIMLFRHYMMVALVCLDGDMDNATAKKYNRIEKAILNYLN